MLVTIWSLVSMWLLERLVLFVYHMSIIYLAVISIPEMIFYANISSDNSNRQPGVVSYFFRWNSLLTHLMIQRNKTNEQLWKIYRNWLLLSIVRARIKFLFVRIPIYNEYIYRKRKLINWINLNSLLNLYKLYKSYIYFYQQQTFFKICYFQEQRFYVYVLRERRREQILW